MALRDIRFVHNRWYALAVLIAAFTSGFFWYALPTSSLLLALPVGVATSGLILNSRKENLHLPILVHSALIVFLVTAGFGVWAAYDSANAFDKFKILIGAVLIFYATVYQPKENKWFVFAIIGIISSLYSIYFIFTYNWRTHPVDTALVNQLGSIWMDIRPEPLFPPILDDIAGGVFAVLAPITVLLFFYGWRTKQRKVIILCMFAAVVTLTGLFMSGLRAAWLGLGVGIVLTGFLLVAQNIAFRFSGKTFRVFAVLFMLFLIAGGVLFIGVLSGDLFPGVQAYSLYWEVRSRFSLFRNAFDLVGDYFLLGGGLRSFPGLYSTYILGIFDFFLDYSHNTYLDLMIEQGIFGLLSYLSIIFAGLWLLMTHRFNPLAKFDERDTFTALTMIGLFTLIIQGLLENSLYGVRGTPFVLLLPALAFMISNSSNRIVTHEYKRIVSLRVKGFIACSIFAGSLLIAFHKPLISSFYANLGSIRLAQVELQEWPVNRADSHIYIDGSVDKPVEFFYRALDNHADNRTANYQLGRIAMERHEFLTAIGYLERAYTQDQHHHGIRKSLGYSYVFSGQIEAAHPVLAGIEEAKYEMTIYHWWWGTQGREDLAKYALQFVESVP